PLGRVRNGRSRTGSLPTRCRRATSSRALSSFVRVDGKRLIPSTAIVREPMAAVVTLQVDRSPGRLLYRLFGATGPIGHPVEHPMSDTALAETLAQAHALLRRAETPSFPDDAVAVGRRLYRSLVPEAIRDRLDSVDG